MESCIICGRDLRNDVFGRRCEDCWAADQAYSTEPDRTLAHQNREVMAAVTAELAAA